MNRKIEKEIIRLVDDDEDQRKALRFLLEAAGYEVRDYPSGRDFLVNDEPSVPGCAILDLQMPEMDGLTLLTIMRANTACLWFFFQRTATFHLRWRL